MITLLEIWGGLFYLLNKVFFCLAEQSSDKCNKSKWNFRAWSIYLAGLPPWIIVLVLERNWIAAAVETGGAPAMLMGLAMSNPNSRTLQKNLDLFAKLSIALGLFISLYDFGGITSFAQILEILVAIGFHFGTYLTAKRSPSGYWWLAFANVCCGILTALQGHKILMIQQLISVVFVLWAIRLQKFQY